MSPIHSIGVIGNSTMPLFVTNKPPGRSIFATLASASDCSNPDAAGAWRHGHGLHLFSNLVAEPLPVGDQARRPGRVHVTRQLQNVGAIGARTLTGRLQVMVDPRAQIKGRHSTLVRYH